MRPTSPDGAWRRPGFVLRRLLRLTTIDARRFEPVLDPAAAAAIGDRIAGARRAALSAGGRSRPARTVLLLAPTPRSGTNFVEALLARHPALKAAPCGIREAPFLAEADRIRVFESGLARRHADNAALFPPYEFLAHAITGFLARAAAESPRAEALVIKDPRARRLELIPALFPEATAIMTLRDGRRTVDSMRRTWPPRFPGRTFADMCREWALATTAALDFLARSPSAAPLRYEAAARDPDAAASVLWARIGLPPHLAASGTELPVLGSSTHSRGRGGVDWRPRERAADFDPAARPLDWSASDRRTFDRIAGAVQSRMDAEHPVPAAARPLPNAA